jgi:hypothetical protein
MGIQWEVAVACRALVLSSSLQELLLFHYFVHYFVVDGEELVGLSLVQVLFH